MTDMSDRLYKAGYVVAANHLLAAALVQSDAETADRRRDEQLAEVMRTAYHYGKPVVPLAQSRFRSGWITAARAVRDIVTEEADAEN
ncbi:hypothetical protein [Nocardia terpenica]|uniref:Uncharacterized protein n=1 Tax=Nocardia terpenica TaxID=455432 RepID=A0A164HF49_9NOCA|nr:hypothetical protein [Nocardia terpenica]KZM68461.1 hypothetical protein AWN90_11360 [Nocardia terpenica]NQE88592.1 hypothetical protein [Nocardia terpenica]